MSSLVILSFLSRDAMLAQYMLSCVRTSVCLSLYQWLNAGSRKERHTIASGLSSFLMPKISPKFPTGSPPNRGGVGSNRRFSTNISLYLKNDARPRGDAESGRIDPA